jgi:hypothetical protein
MFKYRGRGCEERLAVVGILAAAALGGCAEEVELQPGLRIEGPPDVLAVMVARNRPLQSMLILEEATYCRPNDSKRPARVSLPDFSGTQVCPEDVAKAVDHLYHDAFPAYWYVRIVFDELLDYESRSPDDRARIASRQQFLNHASAGAGRHSLLDSPIDIGSPVSLLCNGISVPYTGVYIPDGNKETWPVGPSIEVQPVDTKKVPANAVCELTLRKGTIRDKDGVSPALAQLGPYRFQIAPISLLVPYGQAAVPYGTTGTLPILGSGNPAFRINFNHYLDPASFDANDVRVFRDASENDPSTPLTECGGGTEVPAKVASVAVPANQVASIPSAMTIADASAVDGDWATATTYRVEIGGHPVSDLAGGTNVLDRYTLCFRTR